MLCVLWLRLGGWCVYDRFHLLFCMCYVNTVYRCIFAHLIDITQSGLSAFNIQFSYMIFFASFIFFFLFCFVPVELLLSVVAGVCFFFCSSKNGYESSDWVITVCFSFIEIITNLVIVHLHIHSDSGNKTVVQKFCAAQSVVFISFHRRPNQQVLHSKQTHTDAHRQLFLYSHFRHCGVKEKCKYQLATALLIDSRHTHIQAWMTFSCLQWLLLLFAGIWSEDNQKKLN